MFATYRRLPGEIMTSGFVFVLHGAADAQFAGELAAAFAPGVGLAVCLAGGEGRGITIGAAGSCVIVWGEELAAPCLKEAVMSAIVDARTTIVVARPGDLSVPEPLRAHSAAYVCWRDEAKVVGDQVRAELSRIGAPQAVDRTPKFGREAGVTTPPSRSNMGVRSVAALAATLAVVGMAAPFVGPHAAANNTDDAARLSATPRESADAIAHVSSAPPAQSTVVASDPEAPRVLAPEEAVAPEPVAWRAPSSVAGEYPSIEHAEPAHAPAHAREASKVSPMAAEDRSAPTIPLEEKVERAADGAQFGESPRAGAGRHSASKGREAGAPATVEAPVGD